MPFDQHRIGWKKAKNEENWERDWETGTATWSKRVKNMISKSDLCSDHILMEIRNDVMRVTQWIHSNHRNRFGIRKSKFIHEILIFYSYSMVEYVCDCEWVCVCGVCILHHLAAASQYITSTQSTAKSYHSSNAEEREREGEWERQGEKIRIWFVCAMALRRIPSRGQNQHLITDLIVSASSEYGMDWLWINEFRLFRFRFHFTLNSVSTASEDHAPVYLSH